MTDRVTAPRFAMVPEWIIDHHRLSDGAVRLYAKLMRIAQADNACYPGHRTLASELGVDDSTIKRRLRQLADNRVITVEPRFVDGRQTSNLYHIHTSPGEGVNSAPPGEGDSDPPGGVNSDPPRQESQRTESQKTESVAPMKRNEGWDALEAFFGYRPEGNEAKLWGRIAKRLNEHDNPADELAARVAVYVATWPDAALTPAALDKHLEWLGSRVAASTVDERRRWATNMERQARRARLTDSTARQLPAGGRT